MPSHRLDDALIDYDLTGESGPLVVQLHGLSSSRERDAKIGLDLSRALRDHRVLRYDARGHGRSSGSADEADYGWDRLADDLLLLLDAVAPGEQVHAVGPSMGTGTLLHAAIREPERFRSLTFATPPTAWTTRPAQSEIYRGNATVIESDGLAAFMALAQHSPAPPALADSPATVPEIPVELMPTVLRGAAATDFPGAKEVGSLRIPTLILAWTADRAHPLKTARRLHELIDGSRLIIARTPYGIMAWPALFAEHVTTAGAALVE